MKMSSPEVQIDELKMSNTKSDTLPRSQRFMTQSERLAQRSRTSSKETDVGSLRRKGRDVRYTINRSEELMVNVGKLGCKTGSSLSRTSVKFCTPNNERLKCSMSSSSSDIEVLMVDSDVCE
jgi:hypothetical protein